MLIISLQILKLVLLVVVGILIVKMKILPKEGMNVLSKLLINVTLPILTFFSITSFQLTGAILRDGAVIILFGIVIQVLNLLIGLGLAKKLKLDELRKNVYSAQFMIGNTVYLAFPLATALYGETGLIYAIIYYLISLLFIWTLGIYLFNKHQIKNIREIGKSLVNPCTIAFFLGIIALVLRIDTAMNKWPLFNATYTYIKEAIYPLGETTMSLSMVFIGLIIGQYSLRAVLSIFRNRSIVLLTLAKMILVPIVIMATSTVLSGIASQVAMSVIVIEALMPASTITVAIAKEHGSDYKFAMEIAILTTVVAVLTIPLLLQLYHQFFII